MTRTGTVRRGGIRPAVGTLDWTGVARLGYYVLGLLMLLRVAPMASKVLVPLFALYGAMAVMMAAVFTAVPLAMRAANFGAE